LTVRHWPQEKAKAALSSAEWTTSDIYFCKTNDIVTELPFVVIAKQQGRTRTPRRNAIDLWQAKRREKEKKKTELGSEALVWENFISV
jgi:hypothetical protein